MKEQILEKRQNGMPVLMVNLLVLIAAVVGIVFGAIGMEREGPDMPLWVALFVVSLIVVCVGWIPLLGLKVLKPQEALVLTLFGKYIGTLKGEGFYAVNPFCTAINPGSKTKLGQSGDVKTSEGRCLSSICPVAWIWRTAAKSSL